MIKFRATNVANIEESFVFKAHNLEDAKKYVITKLDKTKSWAIFIVDND